MFTTTVVKTKAGTIGQVCMGNHDFVGAILWESEPFPVEMVESEDKLRRGYERDVSADKASKAAQDKITEVLAGLFA
jgi:hypothetical protein